jgi:hypothetical protein
MAESRFQEEMNDWEDHPGSIEALLHVDAQLHDDPLGYTTWEASGPLAGLLTAATSDEVTHDADAEARAVAGFSVARALDDDNFYGRGRKSGKQRRTVRHAALAGALAAGVLSATSGLAAAAHTSVVKVVSDIADGLRSSGPAHGQSPGSGTSPSTTPNPPNGAGGDPTRVAASDSASSCGAGGPSVSGSASANAACGSVSHGGRENPAPTTNRGRAKRATAPSATMQASGPGDSSTGAAAKKRSRSAGGAVAGSQSGSHKTFSSGSGSGGGSVSGGGSGSKTGNGTGSGTHAVGHIHHHHHHNRHHVDIGVGDPSSGGQ